MLCAVLSCISCVLFFATPRTVIRQSPLFMGFSKQEYWSALPCPSPGDFPDLEIEPVFLMSPALADGIFTTSTTWEAPLIIAPKQPDPLLWFLNSLHAFHPSTNSEDLLCELDIGHETSKVDIALDFECRPSASCFPRLLESWDVSQAAWPPDLWPALIQPVCPVFLLYFTSDSAPGHLLLHSLPLRSFLCLPPPFPSLCFPSALIVVCSQFWSNSGIPAHPALPGSAGPLLISPVLLLRTCGRTSFPGRKGVCPPKGIPLCLLFHSREQHNHLPTAFITESPFPEGSLIQIQMYRKLHKFQFVG